MRGKQKIHASSASQYCENEVGIKIRIILLKGLHSFTVADVETRGAPLPAHVLVMKESHGAERQGHVGVFSIYVCAPSGSESYNMLESTGSDFNWGCWEVVFCYSREGGEVDLLLSRSRGLELD